ncbi:MAG: putative transporter transrane protein [Acidimicrobiales bacterium]|nr:putative transporter transrane protein [Acidimicrobiales bacterium]
MTTTIRAKVPMDSMRKTALVAGASLPSAPSASGSAPSSAAPQAPSPPFVGLLLVIPLVTSFLPSSWSEQAAKYFPAEAGTAIFRVAPDATSLSPWVGFTVLVAYAAVALALGALLLARRDA